MFKKLSITGMSLEEFKEIFDYKKMPLEKEKDALLRTAKDNKGKIVEVERDEET